VNAEGERTGQVWSVTIAYRTRKSKANQKEETVTQTSATQQGKEKPVSRTAIHPFHVNVPETELNPGEPVAANGAAQED
jgi:hypothetical protein